MPQPDNRREQGGITQATQQTVAPTGQMAASISPISGGAAAAAPVLQIGQQAQIQQTGAELYQALAGVAQGIAQGTQNFEKMYNLVSETDYAEFETAYLTEHDRVKGDPTKLKVWMDSQTYKPNRVTSKRYHGLRAQINGKAYEEDQNDMWMADLNKISMMNTTDGLDYLRQRIDQHDPNSPYAKQAERKMIELQSQVATSVHNVNMQGMFLNYQEDNVRLTEQLKTNPSFAQSLDNPAYELILANRALGLATVDPATGMVQLKSGEVFDLNSVTAESMAALQNNIGEFADPQLAMQAYRAARLPAGVTGRKANAGTPGWQVISDLGAALRGPDPAKGIRSYFMTNLPTGEDYAKDMATHVQNLAASVVQSDMPPAEKARQLRVLREVMSYDNESSAGLWDAYGIESKDDFNALFGPAKQEQLDRAFGDAILDLTETSFQRLMQLAPTLSSSNQMTQAFRFTFDSEIIPGLAEITDDVNILMYDPSTGESLKLSLAQYQNPDQMSGNVAESMLGGSLMPVGVEVVDPLMSDKVSTMFGLNPESGFVYVGSGNKERVDLRRDTLEKINYEYNSMRNVDRVLANPNQPPADVKNAVGRLLRTNPTMAIQIMSNPEYAGDAMPSGDKEGKLAYEQWDAMFHPSRLANLPVEERTQTLKGLGMAYARSEVLQARVNAQHGTFGDTLYRYGGLVDPTLGPDAFEDEIKRIHGLRSSNGYNIFTKATEDFGERLDEALFMSQASKNVDPVLGLFQPSDTDAEGKATPEVVWTNTIVGRLETDYLNRFGTRLQDDIEAGEHNKVRTFAQKHLKQLRADALLIGVASPNELIRHVENTQVTTDYMPKDANDLYAPSEVPLTAETQGLLAVIDTVERTSTEGGRALDYGNMAGAFGLESAADYKNFVNYLRTGQVASVQAKQRWDRLKYQLEAGLKLEEVPLEAGMRRAFQSDSKGNQYQESEFIVRLSPEMMREDNWIFPDQPGIAPSIFDQIFGKGKDILIRRQFYPNGAPTGWKTGSEVKDARLKNVQPTTKTATPAYGAGLTILD